MPMRPVLLAALLALLVGCAVEPPRHSEVVTMKAGEATPSAYPDTGVVWRLDESDLRTLSPRPIVPPPPPPNLPPPPRPNAVYPPPVYYSPGYPAPGYY